MRYRHAPWAAFVALALCAPATARQQDLSSGDARLLRFPTLSKESIAFVYAADLWTAPRAGGTARQLTTDAGVEWMPRRNPPSTLWCSDVMNEAVEDCVQVELENARSNTTPSSARRSRKGVVRRL